MAGPALADALAALVAGDLLDPQDAGMLYAPWFNLVGAPPLPGRAGKGKKDEKNAKSKPAARRSGAAHK